MFRVMEISASVVYQDLEAGKFPMKEGDGKDGSYGVA